MIIIENRIAYKFDVDLFDDEIAGVQYQSVQDAVRDEMNTVYEIHLPTSISDLEIEIRTSNDQFHGDGMLNSKFMLMIRKVWHSLMDKHDIGNWAMDKKVHQLDFHRDAGDDGGIINLDTNRAIDCIGCLSHNLEYLDWADAVKRITKGPMDASVKDVQYMIDHCPMDDDIGIFQYTLPDGEDAKIDPYDLLKQLILRDGVVPKSIKPTHFVTPLLN
jgi:hypothetical protein